MSYILLFEAVKDKWALESGIQACVKNSALSLNIWVPMFGDQCIDEFCWLMFWESEYHMGKLVTLAVRTKFLYS